VAEIVWDEAARIRVQQLEEAAPGAAAVIVNAVAMLEAHPLIGRVAEEGRHELVLSRGKSGYVVLYRFLPALEIIFVLAVRHQREAGY
jgi:plasmid stabilization system protein ParE